ncbi:MAG TPA: YdcF family protein [Phnomibacter sp.]|nr:YdcF family protein [Phnomibacter sp.]
MFFVLSKIFYFLLVPYHWVLMLLLAMWLVKNPKLKKRLGIAALLVTIIFSNGYLYGIVGWNWQPAVKKQTHVHPYKVGILLSGMSFGDAKNQRYFGGTCDRFIQTARLYHTGQINKILVTGGDGSLLQNKLSEVPFLRDELLALHVPDSAILMEPASKNTWENAVNSKKLLDSLHIKDSSILITSAMHMRRATACFAKAGLPVTPHVAGYMMMRPPGGLGDILVPNLGLLDNWQYLLKEMVGLAVYKATGKG